VTRLGLVEDVSFPLQSRGAGPLSASSGHPRRVFRSRRTFFPRRAGVFLSPMPRLGSIHDPSWAHRRRMFARRVRRFRHPMMRLAGARPPRPRTHDAPCARPRRVFRTRDPLMGSWLRWSGALFTPSGSLVPLPRHAMPLHAVGPRRLTLPRAAPSLAASRAWRWPIGWTGARSSLSRFGLHRTVGG
jgi:hypothetical protein